INAELTANFRFINPAYRIARPGMLMIPTSVADVSCHAVSPEFSQVGASFRADSIAYLISNSADVHVQGHAPCTELSQRRARGSSAAAHRSEAVGLYAAHESLRSTCTRVATRRPLIRRRCEGRLPQPGRDWPAPPAGSERLPRPRTPARVPVSP